MSYVEKHLIEGETMVYETRLHWTVLIRPILLALLFGLPGLALLAYSETVAGDNSATSESMMAGGAFLLLVAFVFIVRGIVRTLELLLQKVESIGVEESAVGRMLGYGTVTIHGTGGTPEVFQKIAHPLEFRTQVQQQIEKSQGGK